MVISPKVRFLNLFRNLFKLPFLERKLASLTSGRTADHFFCKFVPSSYQYSGGTFRLVNRDGLNLRVDISDYIGHYLYFGFRDKSIEKLFSLCSPEAHVIDVGANIGWTLLNFGKRCTAGRVVGFEPDPENFAVCLTNLELNAMNNIELLQKGLGARCSTASMEVRTPSNRGGNRIAPSPATGTVTVPIERLDDVTEIKSWERIDLIKIDVEGYELHALRGASSILSRFQPVLFVEVDDDNLRDQGDSARALITFLEQTGYHHISQADTGVNISSEFDFSHCHFDIIAQ